DVALQLCDQMLAANPNSIVVWNNRAIVLRRMGRYADALESATRTIQLNPAYAKGWTNRANVLLGLRRYEEAIASAERSLRFDTLRGAYLAKATALMNLGRPDEARSCLERGLHTWPNDSRLIEALHQYGGRT